MKLLKIINGEIENFRTKQVYITPGLISGESTATAGSAGFTFNQFDTIQQIILYHNSRFATGPTDDEGDRKYFHNINRNPCKVFSKAIDFDTKNIRLLTVEGGDSLKTWFMERDLKFWMRDKQFGKVLNRIFIDIPIYGSVVLKIIDGEPQFVDLRNFIIDQSADTLEQANYIIEIHNYTVGEFRKIGQKMGWKKDDVEKVIEEFHKMKNTSHIKLYERYGEVEHESNEGNKTYEYERSFVADVGIDDYDQYGRLIGQHPGVELASDKWEGNPYWEFHASKVPGRWLGVGVVEELFEPQIAVNQNTNLQNKSAFWAALKLFQTRDRAINRNLMSDSRNGEVITTESEITPINMASSENLAFFNQQDMKWLRNRDELTFAYDVVQGERLPAGTPLGSAQIAMTQTLSYFEQIQENIAMDIKEMLYEVIIPQFEKDNTIEHTLRLVGKDLDQYIEMVKNQMVLAEIIHQVVNDKPIPTNKERDIIALAITESIKQKKEKLLKIPRGFYRDVKYDVDIDITGESVDTRVRQATIFAILQAVTSDPTMTQDPIKKKILYMMAENGGINPNEVFDVEKKDIGAMVPEFQPSMPSMGRAGGGVSVPALGQAMPGTAAQTV